MSGRNAAPAVRGRGRHHRRLISDFTRPSRLADGPRVDRFRRRCSSLSIDFGSNSSRDVKRRPSPFHFSHFGRERRRACEKEDFAVRQVQTDGQSTRHDKAATEVS